MYVDVQKDHVFVLIIIIQSYLIMSKHFGGI